MSFRSLPVKEIKTYDLNSSKELVKEAMQSVNHISTTGKNLHREKIVKELIETEITYLKGLHILMEVRTIHVSNIY